MGDIYKVEGISISVVSPWHPILVWIQVTSDVGKPNDEPPNGVRFANMADQVDVFWDQSQDSGFKSQDFGRIIGPSRS